MIKINLELPEFEKELNISVTLRKDGEVISTSSSLPGVVTEVIGDKNPKTENITSKVKTKTSGSNLMDMSF